MIFFLKVYFSLKVYFFFDLTSGGLCPLPPPDVFLVAHIPPPYDWPDRLAKRGKRKVFGNPGVPKGSASGDAQTREWSQPYDLCPFWYHFGRSYGGVYGWVTFFLSPFRNGDKKKVQRGQKKSAGTFFLSPWTFFLSLYFFFVLTPPPPSFPTSCEV